MDIKNLIGEWVLRTDPNIKDDYSYTSDPIYIIGVTDKYILHHDTHLKRTEDNPHKLSREYWDDDKWGKYKGENDDIFSEHIKNVNGAEGINFDEDFYHFAGMDVSKEKINEWIRELKESEEDTGAISSGNTIVIKLYDDIIVAKNYWEND